MGGRSARLSAGVSLLFRMTAPIGNEVSAGEKKGSVRKVTPEMVKRAVAVPMWVILRGVVKVGVGILEDSGDDVWEGGSRYCIGLCLLRRGKREQYMVVYDIFGVTGETWSRMMCKLTTCIGNSEVNQITTCLNK